MIAFRITRTYDKLEQFVQKLSDHCTKLIVYQHDADEEIARDHIHGLVTECTVSTDTLKNWIKNVINCKQFPKSDWSFIAKDKQGNPVNDSFITYMSKGILQPRYVKGYDDDVIEQFRLHWKPLTMKYKFQYVTKPETQKEAKKRQIDMIDDICKIVKGNGLVLTSDIIKVICDVIYVKNNTICGRYKIRDYYDIVRYRTQPESFVKQLTNLCLKE